MPSNNIVDQLRGARSAKYSNVVIPHKVSIGSVGGDNMTLSDPGLFPKGGIINWAGTIKNIPKGWQICNGTNGTPNLLQRFVRSVPTSTTDPGATGGGTNCHNHFVDGSSDVTQSGTDDYASVGGAFCSYGNHTHVIAINTDFCDTLPPYFELAFIQKM